MNEEESNLFAKLITEIYKNEQLQQKVNQLETNRDEVIEVIDKMIHKGWGINGYYYDATGEASEFGARGRRIQQLLERGKK